LVTRARVPWRPYFYGVKELSLPFPGPDTGGGDAPGPTVQVGGNTGKTFPGPWCSVSGWRTPLYDRYRGIRISIACRSSPDRNSGPTYPRSGA